jgi:hypothetical protein
MTLIAPPAMWLGTRWGIEGVAAAGGLSLLAVSFYAFPTTWRVLGISSGDFLRGLRAPTSGTIFMIAVVLAVRQITGAWERLVVLPVLVVAGVVAYVGWLLVMHPVEVRQGMSSLKEAWRGEGTGGPYMNGT